MYLMTNHSLPTALHDWAITAFVPISLSAHVSLRTQGLSHQRADAAFVQQALRLYAVTDPGLNQKHGRCDRMCVLEFKVVRVIVRVKFK